MSRTPSRHVGLGWAGLVGLAGRAVPCTYIHRIDQVERERLLLLLCAARLLETLVSREVPCRGLASRLILARRWNNRRLVGVHPTQRPAATGNTNTSLTPWLLSGPAPPKSAQPLATLSQT